MNPRLWLGLGLCGAGLFFSGFVLPLESLRYPVKVVSFLLPVTYGIEGLREVLIKGSGLENPTVRLDIIVLAAISLVLAVLFLVFFRYKHDPAKVEASTLAH